MILLQINEVIINQKQLIAYYHLHDFREFYWNFKYHHREFNQLQLFNVH